MCAHMGVGMVYLCAHSRMCACVCTLECLEVVQPLMQPYLPNVRMGFVPKEFNASESYR